MNICFLIRSLDRGGAERQLTQLAADLKERGHTVRVITFYPGGTFEKQLVASGVPVSCMNKRGRWHLFGFLRDLRRELRFRRPDVLYSFLTSSNVLSAILSFALPGIGLVWGIRVSDMELTAYGRLDRLISGLERLLARVPLISIANSQAGADICRARGFPESRVACIPNGIDLDRFRPDPGARNALRRRLGLAEETFLVGMIARYDPMKGVDIFLEAAKNMSGGNPDIRFLLAGNGMGRDNPELMDAIARFGPGEQVIPLGACDDVESVLAGLDMATLSSRFGEGFANVIGEAMACGVPVVATDVGDAAVILGDAGWTVPPGDARALSEAWQKIFALPAETRASAGIAGRRRIEEHFERRSVAARTEELLAKVLDR